MTDQNVEPIGRPFSRVYLRPAELLPDSPRFRIRLGALFTKWFPFDHTTNVVAFLRQRGLNLQTHWVPSVIEGTIQTFPISDALDLVTFVHEWLLLDPILPDQLKLKHAAQWRDEVRGIFVDEALAYRVDDACGVHPLVDTAFEMARVSVLAGLGDARYKATREYLDAAITALEARPPVLRAVIKSAFESAEQLFKLAATTDKALTAPNVTQCLKRIVDAHYAASDGSQKAAAGKLLSSFSDWVDAGHKYRHAHRDSEPHEPEFEFAVAYLGSAMTYIRWLSAIDAARRHASKPS